MYLFPIDFMSKPLFSIVIPAFNEENFIVDCIQSVKKQSGGFAFEIIVIDDNSIDQTARIARSAGAKVILEKQHGVGAARRTGTDIARGYYIVQLDADTRLPTDYLVEVLKRFQRTPLLVCLSGQFYFYDGSWFKRFLRTILFYPLIWFARVASRKKIGGFGNNMVFKKEDYNKTKGFNPNLKFGEDADLSRQLSQFGEARFDLTLSCQTSARRFKINKNLLILFWYYLKLCFHKNSNYNFPHSREL